MSSRNVDILKDAQDAEGRKVRILLTSERRAGDRQSWWDTLDTRQSSLGKVFL